MNDPLRVFRPIFLDQLGLSPVTRSWAVAYKNWVVGCTLRAPGFSRRNSVVNFEKAYVIQGIPTKISGFVKKGTLLAEVYFCLNIILMKNY